MLNLPVPELVGWLLEALFGVALTGLVCLIRRIYVRVKTRNLRRFWKPFIGGSLSVIFTEYPALGDERFEKLEETTGSRWLMSKAMAFSLAQILDFCRDYVTKRKDIVIIGDKTESQTTDNMILLGSPAVNRYSGSWYKHISGMYEMPYRIVWSEDAVKKRIVVNDTEELAPDVKDGLGSDYGLVVKCAYQKVPRKWAIMIFGCHMWGTQAGVTAVTDLNILNEVSRYTNDAPNIAFVIKTRVVNNTPTGPELNINNECLIQALKPRMPQQA